MLASFLKRRRDRQNLDYSALTIADPIYGRLDGEDEPCFDLEATLAHAAELDAEEKADDSAPINNDALIAHLEAQIQTAIVMLVDRNEIVEAATELVKTMTALSANGEPIFTTTHDDEVATETLNHRFSDLAALLNKSGRPVPGKLSQGTVH